VGRLPTLVTAWKLRPARDVDAEGRQEAGVRREIDGGNEQARADTAVADLRGAHLEGAAKHPAGAGHVAGGDAFADGGAGNFKAVRFDRRMDLEAKGEVGGEVHQLRDAGLGVVAEAEVAAFVEAAQA